MRSAPIALNEGVFVQWPLTPAVFLLEAHVLDGVVGGFSILLRTQCTRTQSSLDSIQRSE